MILFSFDLLTQDLHALHFISGHGSFQLLGTTEGLYHVRGYRPRLVGHQTIGRKSPTRSIRGYVTVSDVCVTASIQTLSYLIIPLSLVSMNRISISTSSPRSDSDFNFSSACEVFIFDASKILYA